MKPETTEKDAVALSRRGLFRAGIAMFGGLIAAAVTATGAIAKMTQKAAAYQGTPKDSQQCSSCALFKAPDTCTLVDGPIDAAGWCRFYSKKSA